jgi:hypothetical protein
MSHRVHTAVKQVKTARSKPSVNRAQPNPSASELGPRDHPVLSASKLGDESIRPTSLQ